MNAITLRPKRIIPWKESKLQLAESKRLADRLLETACSSREIQLFREPAEHMPR